MQAMIALNAKIASATIPIMPKKNVQVGLRISDEDLKLMRKAGEMLWPGLPISNATLVLTMARQRAEEVLGRPRKK
jgi:uncharacterized protein (DUF1778 family)